MLTSLTALEAWLLYGGIVLGVILILSIILYFTCGFRFKREKKSNTQYMCYLWQICFQKVLQISAKS